MTLRILTLICFLVATLPLIIWSLVVLMGAIILRLMGNRGATFLEVVMNEAPSGVIISFQTHNIIGAILTILSFGVLIIGWHEVTR